MATRIKRYEDRLECQPDLLARIEREMGPDAQIERRYFRRGALLGFLGGQQMVEMIATVEVSDDLLMGKPPKRRASDRASNGSSASVPVAPKTEPATAESGPAVKPEPAERTATASVGRNSSRIIPPPSELPSERATSQRRQVDIRADEQPPLTMAEAGLELEDAAAPTPRSSSGAKSGAAKPAEAKDLPKPSTSHGKTIVSQAKPAANAPAPAMPQASAPVQQPVASAPRPAPKPAATPLAGSEPGALNEALPAMPAPASAMPVHPIPPAPAPAERAAATASPQHSDLTDLRDSINELKETVKLLVQAQTRGIRLEAQNVAAAKSAAPIPVLEKEPAPEPTPEESLAQAAQQAQADEAQLLLELHSGGEPAASAEASAGLSARVVVDPLALDPSALLPTVQRQVFDRLLDWNIGPYDALELINTAITGHAAPDALNTADILKVITGNICRNMLLSGGIKLGKTPPGRVVALVGATGVGKTTTIAKLAAKFAFQEGQRVSLVSLDNYRIAAAEQLRTYSEIMGIDLDIVFSKDEFDAQLTARRHSDLVLIDTAGRSPINTKQIYELREVFAAHPPDEVHLVVSASTKADDLRAILENFTPLGYEHIIVSKLDETRSLGTIYNITKLCQHPISYVTVGQRVPEDIRTATLQFIQQWIDQGRAV